MSFGPVIDELIDSLRVLPGVGQKTAQRMALSLLEGGRSGAKRLSQSLAESADRIKHCHSCRTLSELEQCIICSDSSRDEQTLCVVESTADLLAIEQSHHYKGLYFVLSGSLSPLDGRGPNEIGIPKLIERLGVLDVGEIIMATNPTIEGEATAHYIAELLSGNNIVLSRLAHGIPLGGSLGYIDSGTLSHALSGRKTLFDN